jgi:hypothetical protein
MNKLAENSQVNTPLSEDQALNISLDPANLGNTDDEDVPLGYETDQVISIYDFPMDDDVIIPDVPQTNPSLTEDINSPLRGDEETSSLPDISPSENDEINHASRYSTRSSTRASRLRWDPHSSINRNGIMLTNSTSNLSNRTKEDQYCDMFFNISVKRL